MAFIIVLQLLLYFSLGFMGESSENNERHGSKRLLLNDPDAINNRLNTLELSLQQQQATNLQQQARISQQEATILQLVQRNPQGHGSTFVRWGRSQCPSQTELVYSGYAAGQEYYYGTSRFGGPSNMLCLPKDPELSNRTGSSSSRLYGTEFEGNHFAPGSANEDVPCALCRSNDTSSSVMIPGRKSCYSGWKNEYFGILASGCYNCKASSYICVDMNPEFISGGERNNDNNLLYATSMKCGSLPCPPYHNDLEVYCVVCSK
ncbi:uncharacterized protein LOC143046580 [Mytilus galloprovincialis]|uniref:uncharacterized protein LOC143046580 n=1 Tax=Mytilus galloprovincialis TaxID=29158 RepID=UPI003F7CBE12